MNRRRLLSAAGAAGIGSLGGCLSVWSDSAVPVEFALWNDTDETHTVAVTIEDASDEVVLDRTYEIGPAGSGSTPGGPVIRETDFTEATHDELFDCVASLNGESRWEHRFQATCTRRDTPDSFHIEIEPGREASLGFSQSSCS